MSNDQDTIGNAKRPALHLRLLLVAAVILLLFLMLFARLYYLQLHKGQEFRNLVRHQTIRQIPRPAVRGEIIDRNGFLLAGNSPHWDLTLHPSQMRYRGYLWTSNYMMHTADFLERTVFQRPSDISSPALRKRLKQDMTQPIVLYRDLTNEEIAKLADLPPIDGMEITQRIERHYPFPGTASHLLGHCGWKLRESHVPQRTRIPKELLGNSGLERRFDEKLSGQPGKDIVLMDPVGFVRATLPGSSAPIDGFDLQLTIDLQAQLAAEAALAGHSGALVCLDIHTGEVLAMASAPSYDLSTLSAENYAALAEDKERHPLFHRALHGTYMPGSIVKPLIALTALENHIIAPDSIHDCTGAFTFAKRHIHCANRNGHGPLDFRNAIAVSCNPFFLQTGLRCGQDLLSQTYQSAGFGQKAGFDLPEITTGVIPPPSQSKTPWSKLESALAGIGQGPVSITPLQAACYAAALGNGGTVWRPFLVKNIIRKDGTIVHTAAPEAHSHILASPLNFQLVQEAMVAAVENKGASAEILQKTGIPLAAKTGTAEVGFTEKKDHNTWIICYGPIPHPRFAVACVIEHGVSGAKTTAPVVIYFLRKWLGIK